MPTENRSSNTEMVSEPLPPCADDVFKNGVSACLVGDVPKHAAETICQSLSAITGWKIDWHYIGGRTHIKALAPAEQHQGEPRQEHCDTCHGLGEVATGTVTHHGYNQPPEPDLEVCPECSGKQRWYVAGDIDRLVRELDALLNGDGAAPQAKLCDLVAQVAESKKHQGEPVALPGRRSEPTEESDVFTDAENSGFNTCLDEIAKLGPLYTHADPNVRWKAVADEQMKVIEGLRAQLAERDALLSKALTDLEYIQKECTGDVTPGYIGCLVDDVVDLLSASSEPSAPVEREERAEFEAYCAVIGLPVDRLPSGVYLIPAVRFGWAGWQARAALERK